jgi:uncharacterized protein YbjT (DUF2867 family)
MASRKLIVVTGATGNQGGSVVDHLLQQHSDKFMIHALTRNPDSLKAQELRNKGVQVIQCDLNNYEQVEQCIRDAYAVFAMTNYWESKDDEVNQGKNLANASVVCGIQHLIWASLPDADTITNKTLVMPHYQNKYIVQKYIVDNCQSIPFVTFLYVGFYYSNFNTWFKPQENEQGLFVYNQPLTKTAALPLFDVNDTGAVVTECLLHPEQHGQRSIVPLVSENLPLDQICDTLSEVTGKTVKHIPLSMEEYSIGKPQESVDNMKWYNDFEGKFRFADQCRQVYPHMKTFKQWLLESKFMQ